MGCGDSKQAKAGKGKGKGSDAQAPPKELPTEVYGFALSMNALGAMMLGTEHECSSIVPTMPGKDTKSEEFAKMNPFCAIPAIKDKESLFSCAESNTVLRFMALRYAPKLYTDQGAKRIGMIDWALDRFSSVLAGCVYKTIYPIFEFAEAPADQEAEGAKTTEELELFAKVFLAEKFIGGADLSIADYKVAPFFFAFEHPVVQERAKVTCPDRIKEFNKDFSGACKASRMLLTGADGMSLKETLDKKLDKPAEMLKGKGDDNFFQSMFGVARDKMTGLNLGTKGKVKIYGVPVSMNCMGSILLVEHLGIGEMEQCMPSVDTKSENFTKLNPFGFVPTMKDGDFSMGESNAILRYLAQRYCPQLYPETKDCQKRAFIDWALDRFNNTLYPDAVRTLYPCFEFMEAPGEKEMVEIVKVALNNLDEFCNFFLKDTFIGGEEPSIADFKIAPFFYAYTHPFVEEKIKLKVGDRVKKFVEDFKGKVTAKRLEESDGMSILEYLNKKQNPVEATPEDEAKQDAMEDAMKAEVAKMEDIQVLEADNTTTCGCW